ncbi:terminase family protein [Microbacterium sp. A8/3-1]|uniref:Terminase family protein n=1 Tax=Microbacterium sp. A8/3-1 TaxID=3160749 RepID=A0AAU7VYP4_9MICO
MTDTMIPLSPKQLQSLKEATARINVWEGSVRSGKTIASLVAWLIYVATNKTRGELIVVSRTRDSAARNVFAPLMDPSLFGEISQYISYTSGSAYATVLGRRVWVLGSSDVRSENVLRGLTCAGAYVDEITLLKEDFFTQLLNRLWEGARLFGTTNPDSPAHWFKVNYLDRCEPYMEATNARVLPDWRVWKFYLDDNPQLTEARKDAIRRENTGLFFRRNVNGEWVAAEGAIFDFWDPEKHTIAWDDLPEMRELLALSLDYGTTNPTAALLLGVSAEVDHLGRPAPRLFFVDEWRWDSKLEQAKLTDAELAVKLVAWLNERHLPDNTTMKLTPRFKIIDPSAASFKVQLRKNHDITSTDADNDVLYGIRLMASLISAGALVIARPTPTNPERGCPGFISEAPGYVWDPKATLVGEDKPMKVADHSLDGGRYGVTTTENVWRSYIKIAA